MISAHDHESHYVFDMIYNNESTIFETYHQLHGTIAQVGGKKELRGHTDIEVEISNQCGWLLGSTFI